jgi:hypothetical protein
MVLSTSFHWCGPWILKFECIVGITHGQTRILLKGLEEQVHSEVILKDGIQILRNFCFHKCIIFWGLVNHIAYLPLLGHVKTIKMIVLRSAIPAALIHAQFAIAERGTHAGDKQFIVATVVVAVRIVHVMGTFFNLVVVVVCACLILWVLPALVVGMLAVSAMQMARPVKLTALGGGLAIPARVLVARATSFEAAMITVASRPAIMCRPATLLVTPPAARVMLSALQEPLELLFVAHFKLMVKLLLGSRTKLLIILPLDQAIADPRKKNTLKVLCKSL